MIFKDAVSPEKAISLIRSGQKVFIQGAAATPNVLIKALEVSAEKLCDVELMHIHTEGPANYAAPEFRDIFTVTNFFVGSNIRKYMTQDNVQYLPCFLSEIPSIFRTGLRRPDVALISVSPPDAHGFCSMGTSLDVTRAAVDCADTVIAQINTKMPRILGDTFIHMDKLSAFVEVNEELPEHGVIKPTEVEKAIGQKVADLVEDGATLQVGIGAIPDCALRLLKGHRNLGVHTEMWSNGMLELLKLGVVDNSQKKIHRGRSVSTFLVGDRELYDYVHNNPSVIQLEASYVNDPSVIKQNPKVTAINSAIEVDLTGQICADSIGSRIISGVGGQMDFIRGASLSEGGKPIIAIASRSAKGFPKIVPSLKNGAGVVTTRAHTHWIVSEYGSVNLAGLTISERSAALISLAHPDDRENLDRLWFERGHSSLSL